MPLKRALSKGRKKTMIKSNELREEIEKEINHTWDGRIFVYQNNTCEYIDVTEIMKALYKQEIEGDPLEKIVVVEVKSVKLVFTIECPSCGKAIVITNSASQRAIQKMLKLNK